jgi:enoyl-CoA hydratase/carnithine racemase
MHRPERRNALSLELMHALAETLGIIETDPDVRAVILAAEGSVFSSGHDLTEMQGRTEADYQQIFDVCTRLMLKLHDIPQPVIAEVQGLATAAGCQLVASCDLAVASKDAKFATPGVKVGLFCTTPMVPLVRSMGRKRAFEMLITGDTIDAKTAVAWGLVNEIVPAGNLRKTTLQLARRIAEASPYVVSLGKRAFYQQVDKPERQAYEEAKCVMTSNAQAQDAQEGIAAFLEKRPATWKGR